MTTETKNNETKSQSSDQSTFAPLGKYAAVAVLIVGVIVTTAVMLDKQLNKTETEIASIEDEISKLNKAQAKAHQSEIQPQDVAAKTTSEATINETTVNSVAADSNATNNLQSVDTTVAAAEDTTSATTTETNTDSHQARISSHKTQQKTRMTDMFDRMSKRESKQLEQFKAQQAEQVARLRKRVNVQQQQIDALIQRNENLFKLRSASVQRQQAQREQMLNRI